MKSSVLRGFLKVALFSLLVQLTSGVASASLPSDITLGSARSYAILAGSAITNASGTLISGNDVGTAGISPTIVDTATAASFVTSGAPTFENNTTSAINAQNDLQSAMTTVASLTPGSFLPLIAGDTLTAGVYGTASSAAMDVTGTITLDGGGDPNAIFVFKTDSDLGIAAGVIVNLINGAQAMNVYWYVGAAVTIGGDAHVVGNFLVGTAATIGAASITRGAVLSRGALTMGINAQIIHDLVTPGITPTPA